MKIHTYALSILYLASGLFFLGSSVFLMAHLYESERSVQPEILDVSPLTLDLGKISQGKIAKSTIRIANHSQDKFSDVRLLSSCGCTIASKVPGEFLPGDSCQPVIEFNSFGKRGAAKANLVLEYVTPENQKLTKLIELIAEVEPPVDVTPAKLHFSLKNGSNCEQTIRLNSKSEDGFMIDLLQVDHFAFDCEEVYESADDVDSNAQSRLIRVIFDSDRWKSNVKRMGQITEFKLKIKTNVDSEPVIDVPIDIQDAI